MTAEERRIFTILRAFIEREELPMELPEEKMESAAEERVEEPTKAGVHEAYIVKIDLPKILDPELKEYGPFKAGDLVVLPRQIAEVLLERDAAEKIRISP
jgi:DNA replication factor GINS